VRGMAQVIECLPNKHKALNSNPSTERQRERQRQRKEISCLWKVMLDQHSILTRAGIHFPSFHCSCFFL
jgi:hypothetical protein